MLDGDLLTNQVEQVLLDLGAAQSTGCLTVIDAAAEEAEVYLKEGLVYSVYVPGRRPLLGHRLVSSGDLAPEALAETLEIQRTELHGFRLGELLVHLGYVDRSAVENFVSEQLIDMIGDLLGWHVDSWRFRKNRKARQDMAPPTSVPDVLNQVRERRQRWATLRREMGGPHGIPLLSSGGVDTSDVVLGPGEWSLLCRVDGERSTEDLAIDAGFTVYEAAELVASLVRAGLVDVERTDETLDSPDSGDLTEPGTAAISGSGWDDLPEPTAAEIAESVAKVTDHLERMYDSPSAAREGDETRTEDQADPAAPAGWQDHVAWVEQQRQVALEEARAARAEAEAMAQEMRQEKERRELDRDRRRREAEEVARTVEEARQKELDRIQGERSKEQRKKERKEAKAVEAAAWEEHAAWALAQRPAAELEAHAEEAERVAALRAEAELLAWEEHEAQLALERTAAEEQAYAENATRLAAQVAAAEEEAWGHHVLHLAAERAAAEPEAWDAHAAWLNEERASVEEQAWEDHLTWVEGQLALEAERVAAEEAAELARIEAEEAAAELMRIEAEEAARVEAERLESERLAAEEAAEAERVAIEAAAELARIEAEEAARVEAERVEAERVEAERIAAEEAAAEAARIETEEAAELERLEAEEVERIAAEEAAEAERIVAERIEAERIEAERIEAERIAAEEAAAEAARIETEEAAELERLEAEEAERLEAERTVEAERIAAEEAAELERLEAEEAERLAAEDAPEEGPTLVADPLEAPELPEEVAEVPSIDPPDASLSTEMVMPLIKEVDASPSSWESIASPTAVLRGLASEPPAPRATPAEDDPEAGSTMDDRPTPIVDRSMTDTASLLRELSGLFHADDPEPARPAPTAPKPPPPAAKANPPKKKKGLFGRGG